jgi:succinate dehydrogenase / fumarate reductase flavoprotein subunit
VNRQINLGKVKMYTRHEMMDVVKIEGEAKGIVTRDLITGEIETHAAHAVLLCTGGYGNVFYLSTNAMGCNVTAAWKAHKRGAFFANPCFTQIHPTCIPVTGDHQSKLTLMSESLRNDGRVWAPKTVESAQKIRNGEIKMEDLVIPAAQSVGLSCNTVLINQQDFTKTSNIWGVKNNKAGTNSNRIVILTKS